MKQQVVRFSPHQNAKVFAVMTAVSSLVFVVPFALLGGMFEPANAALPLGMLIVMPLLYLVFGYLSVAFGCWFYNRIVRYTGGIEFESAARVAD